MDKRAKHLRNVKEQADNQMQAQLTQQQIANLEKKKQTIRSNKLECLAKEN